MNRGNNNSEDSFLFPKLEILKPSWGLDVIGNPKIKIGAPFT